MMPQPVRVDRLGRRYSRPPGPKPREEVAYRILSIRVTEPEYAEIQEVAGENQCSINKLLRDALNTYVGDYVERRVFARRRDSATYAPK